MPSKPTPWEPSVVPWPPSWSGNSTHGSVDGFFFDPNGEQKHRVKTKKIWEHSTFSQKSKRLDGFGFFDSIEKYSRQSVKMEVVKT